MFVRIVFLGAAFTAAASAQGWSVGVAGGGSLTGAFSSDLIGFPGSGNQERSFSQSKDYLAGFMIEHPLPASFSVEADALFRELHMTVEEITASGRIVSPSPSPVVTWEFPVLGKYRLHWSKLDPFVEAGPSFRTTGNLNAYPSHYGVAAGVGVQMHWRAFDFAPVIRYTRWERDPPPEFIAESKSDQIEVLVGISRRTHWGAHAGTTGFGSRFTMGLAVGTNLASDYPVLSGSPTTGLAVVPAPGGGFTLETVPATVNQSGSNSAIGGLAIEFGLQWKLYGEIDALHHPLCVTDHVVFSTGFVRNSSGCGVTWEIPLLAKYKFGPGRVRPLIEAGPSVRSPVMIGGYGVTAGAGVEVRAGVLRIAPIVRFTRWTQANAEVSPVSRNEIELVTEFLL